MYQVWLCPQSFARGHDSLREYRDHTGIGPPSQLRLHLALVDIGSRYEIDHCSGAILYKCVQHGRAIGRVEAEVGTLAAALCKHVEPANPQRWHEASAKKARGAKNYYG